MPYKSPGARRTANREAQRRRRANLAALPDSPSDDLAVVADAAAVPSPCAIEEGPAPRPDDGEFVTLRHRCVRCREVSEIAVPPIGGLGELAVSTLEGLCAICSRMPPEDDTEPGADLGAAPRDPSRRPSPEPAPIVARPSRPSRAEVLKAMLAGSSVLIADESGRMRPCAEVLAEDANRATLAPPPVDPRNYVYRPNLHGAIQTSGGRDGELGPVDLPATAERAAVFVRRAPTSPTRTVYRMPR